MTVRGIPERFLVAFSFAGDQRDLVRAIAAAVERTLGSPNVFFDEWFEHYIAGADADLKLQDIYGTRSALTVVCVSARYGNKPWTLAEHEAIRARVMMARCSTDRRDKLGILPIRVGDGEVEGILFNAIVPDVRTRTAEATATLIVDRLRLIVPNPDPPNANPLASHSSEGPSPGNAELVVQRIDHFDKNRALIVEALALYEKRIPADERYDAEQMVDLVRRHLSDEFGAMWKLHFLVATFAGRCVGMLICYEDLQAHFAFISYLAAQNPRCPGRNPPDVSAQLAKGLVESRQALGLKAPRFLFEVDSPALTDDPKERVRRTGRLKLFERLAPFEGLHLRALDLRYLQPRLEWPATAAGAERELLLCYAAPGLQNTLPRSEVADILRWTYTELYGDDIFEDPRIRAEYGLHIRQLLDTAVRPLPEQVRLLRWRDI